MMEIQETDDFAYDSSIGLKQEDPPSDMDFYSEDHNEKSNGYFNVLNEKQPFDTSAKELLSVNDDGVIPMSDQFKHFSQSIRQFLAAVKPPSEPDGTARLRSEEISIDEVVNNPEKTGRSAATALKGATRRVRCRRNPVWQHFRVENSLAICLNCDYSTRSMFSTNLKVHLRSHHADLYESVRKAENDAGSSKHSPVHSNENPLSPISADGNSDCDSTKDSRPPTRGDTVSPHFNKTSAQLHRSDVDAFLSFPSLSSSHFSQRNLLSIDLESVLRGVHLNAANLFGGQLTVGATTADEMLSALTAAGTKSVNHSTTGSGKVTNPASFADNVMADSFRTTKRRRLRRHPVWRFFADVDEQTVGCVMCNFKTRSAFSTNLKMHLRAHHKEQYLTVMESELEQCHLENNGHGEGMPQSADMLDSAESGGLRRLKRKRKSVEEIQGIINKCKVNLAKERQRRGSLDPATTAMRIDENVAWLPALAATNEQATPSRGEIFSPAADTPANGRLMTLLRPIVERKPTIGQLSDVGQRTFIEQLNPIIGAILKNGSDSNNNNNNHLNAGGTLLDNNKLLKELQANNAFSAFSSQLTASDQTDTNKQFDDIRRLFEFCNTIKGENDRLLRNVVMKQAIDSVLKQIVDELGSPRIISLPAFRLLISALAPEYEWNHVDA